MARWVGMLGLLVLGAPQARAQPADTPDWVRAQVAAGHEADLDARCGTAIDPCHELSAAFVQELLLKAAPMRRVDIAHAVVVGRLDLSDAQLGPELSITHSTIRGDVDLSRARLASRLSLEATAVEGVVDASSIQVARDLDFEAATLRRLKLNEAEIGSVLNLHGATVDEGVDMPNARVGADVNLSGVSLGSLDASGVRVDGRILATEQRRAAYENFGDASTRGDLTLGGTLGEVMMDSVHVGSTLHMDESATFAGTVTLNAAQVERYWDVAGVHLEAGLTARSMHVGQQVSFTDTTVDGETWLDNAHLDADLLFGGTGDAAAGLVFKRGLHLGGARIGGTWRLDGVRFGGDVAANGMQVSDSLLAIRAAWDRPADMHLLRVGQDLDLSGATLPALDLSGASVGGMLRLSGVKRQTCWNRPGAGDGCQGDPAASLRLLNAHAGAVEGRFAAWPPHLALSGFGYGHFTVDGDGPDIPAGAWDEWLRRDRYSPQHYQQLANVLAADGNRDGASDMQYAARERERALAREDGRWVTYAFLTTLSAVAGYGIGDYTWRVLYWVAGATLVGAVCVWLVRRTHSRNVFWPVGASLEKLLPYVNLDRSFTEFFEQQANFRLWHKLVFGAMALLGSVLGLFLAAAASGLTQKG